MVKRDELVFRTVHLRIFSKTFDLFRISWLFNFSSFVTIIASHNYTFRTNPSAQFFASQLDSSFTIVAVIEVTMPNFDRLVAIIDVGAYHILLESYSSDMSAFVIASSASESYIAFTTTKLGPLASSMDW